MFEKARPDVKEDVPSPMVGRIVAVEKSAGDMVEAGEVLLVVSAMKMVSSTKSKLDLSITGG